MSTILVIDDNEPPRELLARALERQGYHVLAAGNGVDGIKLMQQNEVALLVTDIVMPEQDGLESIQRARKLQPDLPVIVISGDAPRHAPLYLKIAGHLGAHKILMKPFAMETLLTAVREILPPSAPAATAAP